MTFITLLFRTVFNADNIKSLTMITEEMYEIEIPIIIEKNMATYEYGSSARGCYAYMDTWNPLIGEILKCKRELTNEVDKHAVTIMSSNSLGKESVVGHIPQNISKCSLMFLFISFSSNEVKIVGKRLNRGGGYGLGILVKYCFYGQENTVQWLAKKLETTNKDLACKISKYLT